MAFGSKNSTPSFVLTLPFDISLNEQDYLYKEFKKCGVIYNQLVSVKTGRTHPNSLSLLMRLKRDFRMT